MQVDSLYEEVCRELVRPGPVPSDRGLAALDAALRRLDGADMPRGMLDALRRDFAGILNWTMYGKCEGTEHYTFSSMGSDAALDAALRRLDGTNTPCGVLEPLKRDLAEILDWTMYGNYGDGEYHTFSSSSESSEGSPDP